MSETASPDSASLLQISATATPVSVVHSPSTKQTSGTRKSQVAPVPPVSLPVVAVPVSMEVGGVSVAGAASAGAEVDEDDEVRRKSQNTESSDLPYPAACSVDRTASRESASRIRDRYESASEEGANRGDKNEVR